MVLLTSSSQYMSELAKQELDLDDVLCNTLEVTHDHFTGALREPICFGEGKVAHARRLAEHLGASLSDCSFYTDSFSDLPVLEIVGSPRIVQPDPRLAREARRRGWPVMDWD